ncbi:hypothetical protein GGR52DRAFT_521497 [Hypoxylon sp. FL1284]|nr:hypothetical protein GGR52DRAFT_521497 [Hypoxylon sp. FL1284]
MPSRRNLPTLPIFSRHSAPASRTSSTPSIQSPAPVTPPARLHLRNILPECPDGMPTPPPPPRLPFAWRWQCHSCSTIYKIGCTRRCLVCSHEFCVSATAPRSGTKRRRRANGTCASEFDYSGWADWGAWRRKVVGSDVGERSPKTQREQAFAARTHNCMRDCDYPSECHHERYRLHREAPEKRQLEVVVEEPRSPPIVENAPVSLDDELPLNEAIEVREYEDEGNEQKSPTSPKSPLRQTSFFVFVDPDEVDGADEEEEEPEARNEGRKKRKTETYDKDERPVVEQGEADHSDADAEDIYEDALQRLIEEDQEIMPLELLETSETPRCPSRMSNREHPKHSSKLTVRNVTDAYNEDESSDSESETSSSASSSSSSDGEWLSASELTSVSGDGLQADNDESEGESDGELDELVRAEKSFLRE